MSVQAETDLASGISAELLVPGDTAGFAQVASTLRSHARVLEEAASTLSRVDVTNWRGQASVGFRQVIDVEPRRWRTAADAFVAGAVAIEGFVASLVPARETARQARAKYQEYVRLVASAAALTGTPSPLPGPSTPASGTMSTADRMRIGARADQMNTIAARGPDLGTIGALAVQEVFAADALRRQAIEMLTRARATIESAGNIAADALATAMEQAPAARRFDEANIRPAAAVATGHAALDMGGMVPGIGEVADLTNAGWYLSEGHPLDAAVSMAGTIPLAGSAAVGGRLLRNAAKHSDDVGEAVSASARSANRSRLGSGGLWAHEVDGSHTLEKHMGKTDQQLWQRLRKDPKITGSSSFPSIHDAELFTETVLAARETEIAAWMVKGPTLPQGFQLELGQVVGRGLRRGESEVHDMTAVKVFLLPDARFPEGYRILTSYPTSPTRKGSS